MNISDNIKERLRKIYALATQGVEGEREAAEHQLRALMEKYSLTIDDITGEKKSRYTFTLPRYKDEQTIFWQVIMSYLDKSTVSYARRGSEVELELSKEEYIDISSMHEFYLKEYRKDKQEQLRTFAYAFTVKNELFCKQRGDEDDDSSITPEEIRRALAARMMAENMERKQYHRQLGE